MNITVLRKKKVGKCTTDEVFVDGVKFCDALEPLDRGLVNKAVPKDGENRVWKECRIAAIAMKSSHFEKDVAIPTGCYKASVVRPNRRGGSKRIGIFGVPGWSDKQLAFVYDGTENAEGMCSYDPKGNIILGNLVEGRRNLLEDSKQCAEKVAKIAEGALKNGDIIVVKIATAYSTSV